MEQRRCLIFVAILISDVISGGVVSGYTDGCLNRWGAVIAYRSGLVNEGLASQHADFGAELFPVDRNVTINTGSPFTASVNFEDLAIQRIRMEPHPTDLQVATLFITFSTGDVTLNIGPGSRTFDLGGKNVEIDVVIRSVEEVTQDGKSKVSLKFVPRFPNAFRVTDIGASGGSSLFLESAFEEVLAAIFSEESPYEMLSFEIPSLVTNFASSHLSFHYDYVMMYGIPGSENHVCAGLITWDEVQQLGGERRLVLDEHQIISNGLNVAFSIENHFLLEFLLRQWDQTNVLSTLGVELTNGCPGSLTLKRSVTDVTDGVELRDLRLTLVNDQLKIQMAMYKRYRFTYINAEYKASVGISYDNGTIYFETDNILEHRSVSRKFPAGLFDLPGPTTDTNREETNNVIDYVMNPMINDFIPRINGELGGEVQNFYASSTISVGGRALDVTSTRRMRVDRLGNLQLGSVGQLL